MNHHDEGATAHHIDELARWLVDEPAAYVALSRLSARSTAKAAAERVIVVGGTGTSEHAFVERLHTTDARHILGLLVERGACRWVSPSRRSLLGRARLERTPLGEQVLARLRGGGLTHSGTEHVRLLLQQPQHFAILNATARAGAISSRYAGVITGLDKQGIRSASEELESRGLMRITAERGGLLKDFVVGVSHYGYLISELAWEQGYRTRATAS